MLLRQAPAASLTRDVMVRKFHTTQGSPQMVEQTILIFNVSNFVAGEGDNEYRSIFKNVLKMLKKDWHKVEVEWDVVAAALDWPADPLLWKKWIENVIINYYCHCYLILRVQPTDHKTHNLDHITFVRNRLDHFIDQNKKDYR